MAISQAVLEIDYPESDGKPMAETDLHRDWMVRLIDILKHRYRGQQVYVSGDLLVYYENGNGDRSVAPDVFVVKDCDPGRRRTYKIWEEGRSPDMVIEVTSKSTKKEDEAAKPEKFALMGVREYFLYDPTSDYLSPPLYGYRLEDGEYHRIEPAADGSLACEELGMTLRLDGDDLQMHDVQTGEELLPRWEEESHLREAEEKSRKQAESARRKSDRIRRQAQREREQAEQQRVQAEQERDRERQAREAAEAELEELRKRLGDADA